MGNCVTGVQANISKPTQFIYLAFEIKALRMLMGRLPELVNVHLLLKFAFISFSIFGVYFFLNRLTFVGNVFTDVGFKIGVRNFKFVITKDNADLTSKSDNSFPGILMWLGSQQNIFF